MCSHSLFRVSWRPFFFWGGDFPPKKNWALPPKKKAKNFFWKRGSLHLHFPPPQTALTPPPKHQIRQEALLFICSLPCPGGLLLLGVCHLSSCHTHNHSRLVYRFQSDSYGFKILTLQAHLFVCFHVFFCLARKVWLHVEKQIISFPNAMASQCSVE